MNFVRITYLGKKLYRDRATGHIWSPDEEKLVSEAIAKPLLKFVEFKRTAELAKPEPTEEGAEQCAATTDKPAELTEQEIAALEQKVLDDKAQEVDDQREAMLTTVQGMNKTALTEYAKKYDHSFDPKAKVDDMRIAVNGLIHQFGVR
ncbi:hypothetical protein [Comamonas fluminis]|uniref:hypothetical protein n=1 Tax=Comamonas fluminis TaxID=2796366 RepID=UPI001C48438F|nr:hypothetical protein [Comamonas fluminis]